MPPTLGAIRRVPVAPPTLRQQVGPGADGVGELRLPAGAGPFPVAVLVHGGCFMRGMGGIEDMRPLAEVLRAEGIASWSVHYRALGEDGGGWPGTFADVATAADALRGLAARHPIDTTRVVAVGHSAGASLAGWLALRSRVPATALGEAGVPATRPLAVHGVVAVDGPLDLAAARPIGGPVCGRPTLLEELFGGPPSAHPARYALGSPAAGLARSAAGLRQAVVLGQLDAVATQLAPAAALGPWAAGAGAAVFRADARDHFTMLDPLHPAFAATRDAVRHAFGLAPEGRAGADRAALLAAYRAMTDGMHARRPDVLPALLAPDFEHHALGPTAGAPKRVTSRAQFVAGFAGMFPALDSLATFDIAVREVALRGDSAEVHYREVMDARWRPRTAGGAPVRDSSTTWWRDRWVRTPAGWRAVRFEEVAAPAER